MKLKKINFILKAIPFKKLNNSYGQIIVEYILLLLVSIVIAVAILKLTNLEESPFLRFWIKTTNVIGEDVST